MLNRLFPGAFDNAYRGHRLAIWLFVPVVLSKLAMGANSLFNTRHVATSADGIPLDSFGSAGAEAVVAFFAVWGLCETLFASLGVLAFIRYRAMIPFVYFVLAVEHLGRKAIFFVNPIAKAGAATIGTTSLSIGAAVNYTLIAMMLLGLVLSLTGKGYRRNGGAPL